MIANCRPIIEQGGEKARWSTKIQEALSFNLEQWRSGLPEYMRWEDSDPPAKDINTARMRGKYYGAKYLIHRPLLHHALHPMAPKPRNPVPASSPAQSTVSSSQSQVSPSLSHVHQAEKVERYTSEMGPPVRTPSNDPQPPLLSDLEPKVFDACMVCINAAMNSTVAFDGVEGRPIVTNIFGTAHAYVACHYIFTMSWHTNFDSVIVNSAICLSSQQHIHLSFLPLSMATNFVLYSIEPSNSCYEANISLPHCAKMQRY